MPLAGVLPNPYRIEITGSNHQWQVRYPDEAGRLAQGRLLADSILHVPAGSLIQLVLKSEDYLYTVAIPDLGLKEIACPRLEFSLEFQAEHVGRMDLVGDELCGSSMEGMLGVLVIESPQTFRSWLKG